MNVTDIDDEQIGKGWDSIEAGLDAEPLIGTIADPQPQVDIDTRAALVLSFTMLASTLAPGWEVEQQHVDVLAGAWAPVVDKWMPGMMSMVGVEAVAVVTTFALLQPYLAKPRFKEAANAT